MSSASKPSFSNVVTPSASRTSLMSEIWPGNSCGRLAAVGLVVGVLLGAERLAGDVERHADVGGLLVAQDVDEHRREAEHRIGVLPGGGREVLDREGEEGSVGDGMAVDQQQAVHWPDSSHVLRHGASGDPGPLDRPGSSGEVDRAAVRCELRRGGDLAAGPGPAATATRSSRAPGPGR